MHHIMMMNQKGEKTQSNISSLSISVAASFESNERQRQDNVIPYDL